jgi:hypothetical protein
MQISTSLIAYCAYYDWCNVCEGNGQSCCTPALVAEYCDDKDMCTIDSCGVQVCKKTTFSSSVFWFFICIVISYYFIFVCGFGLFVINSYYSRFPLRRPVVHTLELTALPMTCVILPCVIRTQETARCVFIFIYLFIV